MAALPNPSVSDTRLHYDIIVIGGGFGGCYSLYKFRKFGFSTHLFEAGTALGGVWHWNSYPGARVDSEIPYYQFSIPEVWRGWTWTQRFPGHDELKAYFRHVDKVLNLSKDISYGTIVTGADFDVNSARWTVTTSTGKVATCKFLVPATGSSHKRYEPDFPNMSSFQGTLVHSSTWPESGIDFKGKRVAVIGAGATGVQCVQETAKQAEHLTVYIRNPNIALPMRQRELSDLEQRSQKGIYRGLFSLARQTPAGIAYDSQMLSAQEATPEQREEFWEELWQRGGFNFQAANYWDFLVNDKTNHMLYEFWAKKTRARLRDPVKREIVVPTERPYPFATKRSSLEQDYYECLDQDNVEVVSLKLSPLREFTAKGIVTEDGKEREHDIVILATGYDNVTGSLTRMGVRGKDGIDLKERWKDGVWTYLGIMTTGCPNMLIAYGPQAPTAFTNAPVFIERQVDFIADWLVKLRNENIQMIEPRRSSVEFWKDVIQDMNDRTLIPLNKYSWYLGANIPGKPREQLNFVGGMGAYFKACDDALKDWYHFNIVHESERATPAKEDTELFKERVLAVVS